MSRETDEWFGKTDDTPIPKRVKDRILLRYDRRCHRTGVTFRAGDRIEFDHIKALCNGGENRESNIAPILGGKVHRAKTAEDVGERVKTARVRLKHLGQWPKGQKIASRGFEKRWAR